MLWGLYHPGLFLRVIGRTLHAFPCFILVLDILDATMACHQIYADQLATLKRGFPLWEPDPSGEYEQVEVGDVGYSIWGSFQRFFNILLPADHPSQTRGVPECFEPLILPEARCVKTRILPAGKYMSRGIRHVELSGGASRCEHHKFDGLFVQS